MSTWYERGGRERQHPAAARALRRAGACLLVQNRGGRDKDVLWSQRSGGRVWGVLFSQCWGGRGGGARRETCRVSTEGWTRRVHFVREGGGGGGLSTWTIQLRRSSKNAQASNTLAKRAASSLPRGPASRQKETADARYARGAWVHTARRASGPAGRRAAPAASTAHPRPAPRSTVNSFQSAVSQAGVSPSSPSLSRCLYEVIQYTLSLSMSVRGYSIHPFSLDVCTRLFNTPSLSRCLYELIQYTLSLSR